jgi:hypothetical protein
VAARCAGWTRQRLVVGSVGPTEELHVAEDLAAGELPQVLSASVSSIPAGGPVEGRPKIERRAPTEESLGLLAAQLEQAGFVRFHPRLLGGERRGAGLGEVLRERARHFAHAHEGVGVGPEVEAPRRLRRLSARAGRVPAPGSPRAARGRAERGGPSVDSAGPPSPLATRPARSRAPGDPGPSHLHRSRCRPAPRRCDTPCHGRSSSHKTRRPAQRLPWTHCRDPRRPSRRSPGTRSTILDSRSTCRR